MRIVVNDIAASSGGAMTILTDFYHYIKTHDLVNEWIFLLNDAYLKETDKIKIKLFPRIKKSHFQKLMFDFITGKREISLLKPDVVLSLQNIITFGLNVPQIAFIHQSIPFQEVKCFSFFRKSERSLAVYQYLIGQIICLSVKKANQVIVQTDWMKKAIQKKTGIIEEKIHICTPEMEDISKYQNGEKLDICRFFYPAGIEIYKNHNCIYSACSHLRMQGYKEFFVKLTCKPQQIDENILYTGILTREQVLNEYNYSTLIFPSYIESYGLPMAEARAMGTMILASDCPFSREILAGYENAYFFDPFQPKELAELMAQVIKGELTVKPSLSKMQQTAGWSELISLIGTLK